MITACILVCCEAGRFRDVVEEMKKISGVRRLFGVHGRWDVVIELEVLDLKSLGEAVLKLHGLQGVRATETLIGF
jgi:DNA-binding Lrp family transcriptional regulator